ncbi:MAG TPA: hypothetical protein VFV28_09210, partial [Limnobacter sp.]|nr:hypothetical protein [Limnobacter sp.]
MPVVPVQSASSEIKPNPSRRNLLKTFLGGAMASNLPWLTACGSDGSTTGPGGRTASLQTNSFGGTALDNKQFRFRNIGPLGEPDANGVRTAAGFSTRVVAISNLPPAAGATPWHIFNDGGGV